jgi:hypothetical protein
VGEKTDEYSTSVERYYNFNEDISIELPFDDSGNLPDGWNYDLFVKDESSTPGVPLDEALKGITGDEDWRDPLVVESVYEMYATCADSMGFFNSLPEEGQLALHDYINSFSFIGVVSWWTAHYDVEDKNGSGVFYFEGKGIKAEVDLNAVRGAMYVWIDPII